MYYGEFKYKENVKKASASNKLTAYLSKHKMITPTHSGRPVPDAEEVFGEVWVALQRVHRPDVTREVGHDFLQGSLGLPVARDDHPLLRPHHELGWLHSRETKYR